MDKRSRTLIGGAVGLLIVVLALPAPSAEDVAEQAGVASATTPADDGAPDAPVRVATSDELAAQRARATSIHFGRDPFARPETPPEPEVDLEELLALVFPPDGASPTTDSEAPVLQETPVEEPPSLPHLTGISLGPSDRWAIIDRELVQEGDELASGHRIAKIDRRSVTLLWDAEETILDLGGDR